MGAEECGVIVSFCREEGVSGKALCMQLQIACQGCDRTRKLVHSNIILGRLGGIGAAGLRGDGVTLA